MNRRFASLLIGVPMAACWWFAGCGDVVSVPPDDVGRSGSSGASSGDSGKSGGSGSTSGSPVSGKSGGSGSRSGSPDARADTSPPPADAVDARADTDSAPDASENGWSGQFNGIQPASDVLTPAVVTAAYDNWRTHYVVPCGGEAGPIVLRVQMGSASSPSSDGLSEGTGYGMLLAVATDHRADFDGMLAWYEQRKNKNGLMAWQGSCESPPEGDSEPGADVDIAQALIMAASRWDPAYRTKALTIIAALKAHTMIEAGGLIVQKPSDSPYFGGPTCLNPSYFAPAAYRMFAAVAPADKLYWEKAAADAYTVLDALQAKYNGLVPEWAAVDGAPPTECGQHQYEPLDFGQDAVRVPWRVGLDYVWFGSKDAKEFLDKFNVNKMPLGDAGAALDRAAAWGAFAVAAMAGTDATLVTEYTTKLILKNDNTYYDETLRSLYLLTLARRLAPAYATTANQGAPAPTLP